MNQLNANIYVGSYKNSANFSKGCLVGQRFFMGGNGLDICFLTVRQSKESN